MALNPNDTELMGEYAISAGGPSGQWTVQLA